MPATTNANVAVTSAARTWPIRKIKKQPRKAAFLNKVLNLLFQIDISPHILRAMINLVIQRV
jgi:hypothetical protein